MNTSLHAGSPGIALSPPLAPIVLRVGVVGHRPDRLQDARLPELGERLGSLLVSVREACESFAGDCAELHGDAEVRLCAISPLAEGIDRIFAERAIAQNYELHCILPFPKAEYENDFAPGKALEENSLQRFQQLLLRTATSYELDGSRAAEATAYGVAGRVVHNQSDVLFVVWDGERRGKRGGTEETMEEALRVGTPVVWIDAHAPHAWQLLMPGSGGAKASPGTRAVPHGGDNPEALWEVVIELLRMPHIAGEGESHEGRKGHGTVDDPTASFRDFTKERQPRWTLAALWKAFRDAVGAYKFPSIRLRVTPFEAAVLDEWPADRSTEVDRLIDSLRPYYAWTDKLAVLYADRYRSAFVFAFFMAAIAVGLALVPIVMPKELPASAEPVPHVAEEATLNGGEASNAPDIPHLQPSADPLAAAEIDSGAPLESIAQPHGRAESIAIGLEFIAILSIVAIIFWGRKARWHQKWIDYRLAAELIRHLRIVAPLGGGQVFPRVPDHWDSYGHPSATWMAWYVRSIERWLGLPSVVVDREHLLLCLGQLRETVALQADYHGRTDRISQNIEHRLHWVGIFLLALTAFACFLHLLPGLLHSFHLPGILPNVLTFLCGFLPALGASLAGIVNQGEFRRIAKRSRAMKAQLLRMKARLDALQAEIDAHGNKPQRQYSVEVAALAEEVSGLLVYEVLDWRVVFLDRPLLPPS